MTPRDRGKPGDPPEPGGPREPGDRHKAGDGEPGATEQALRALEERLGRASDAAERLIAEAAGAAARGLGGEPGLGSDDSLRGPDESAEPAANRQPPPAGWESPESAQPSARGERELDALIQFVGSLRDLIPPDLQRRLAEAVRELLLAVRALIDWYLERLEQRRRAPTPIEDIPIL